MTTMSARAPPVIPSLSRGRELGVGSKIIKEKCNSDYMVEQKADRGALGIFITNLELLLGQLCSVAWPFWSLSD